MTKTTKSRPSKKVIKPRPAKSEWIRLKEGDLTVYVYLHPDPAIHQRFSIERGVINGRKTPYFLVRDELAQVRGGRDKLFKAKKLVETQIQWEDENPNIRTGITNDIARGDVAKAFMRIIDYIDEQDSEVKDEIERDLDSLRRNLRNI